MNPFKRLVAIIFGIGNRPSVEPDLGPSIESIPPPVMPPFVPQEEPKEFGPETGEDTPPLDVKDGEIAKLQAEVKFLRDQNAILKEYGDNAWNRALVDAVRRSGSARALAVPMREKQNSPSP